MRTLILGLFFVFGLGFTSASYGQSASYNEGSFQVQGGDYWPWGKEIDFPWKAIQGFWGAYDKSGCTTYFLFKVLTQYQERILTVEQYDARTCKLIGRGIGYERNRVVRARFTGEKGDFDLRIHVFKESDILEGSGRLQTPSLSKLVTVMSMSPAGNPAQVGILQIFKVGSDPSINCK